MVVMSMAVFNQPFYSGKSLYDFAGNLLCYTYFMISLQQEFGRKLKKVREERGLTQEEVARRAEMKGNYYAKIERGGINATLETIYKLIKALKAKSNDILPD